MVGLPPHFQKHQAVVKKYRHFTLICIMGWGWGLLSSYITILTEDQGKPDISTKRGQLFLRSEVSSPRSPRSSCRHGKMDPELKTPRPKESLPVSLHIICETGCSLSHLPTPKNSGLEKPESTHTRYNGTQYP